MGLLFALIIGGVIGFLAAQIGGRDEGIIASVVIGIIGAIIGSLLAQAVSGSNQGFGVLTWPGVLWTFVGSIILVVILNALQFRSHRI